ncbi:MAG: hypothetical protein FK730_03020 [Asgard group archaeon]|nr:hypothetical protein [Asgard group archaeon]
MVEVTDLHVLAKLSQGSPIEEDAFTIRDINSKEIVRIHNLRELVDALSNLTTDEIFPSLCRTIKDEIECDIALWIHYVLGDAVLSAKIFNLANEYKDRPDHLKIQVFNLCFNRYLNYQELMDYSDDFSMFNDESAPSDL